MKKILIIENYNTFYVSNEDSEGNTRIHTIGELVDTLKKFLEIARLIVGFLMDTENTQMCSL